MNKILKTCLFSSSIILAVLGTVGITKLVASPALGENEVCVLQEEELVRSALAFEAAIETYMGWPEGQKEYLLKNSLREAYLNTDATGEEISQGLANLGSELGRRVCEWNRKIELGFMTKNPKPAFSLNQFVVLAKEYDDYYTKLKDHPVSKNYVETHFAFKNATRNMVRQGVSICYIANKLRDSGVKNKRVLAKIPYWNKKDFSSCYDESTKVQSINS